MKSKKDFIHRPLGRSLTFSMPRCLQRGSSFTIFKETPSYVRDQFVDVRNPNHDIFHVTRLTAWKRATFTGLTIFGSRILGRVA